jgi:uncharacterized membrane protein YphA (DoxX/SURF4 family)
MTRERAGIWGFALTTATFGALHLAPRLSPALPAAGPPWFPLPAAAALGLGVLLVGCGLALATRGAAARLAAIPVGAAYLAIAAWKGWARVAAPLDPGAWTGVAEGLCLAGGACLVAGARGAGRLLYAVPLLVFGVLHMRYPVFISNLIPAWVPARLALAYAVGVGFFAAALAIASGVASRLAAGCLAAMFAIFVAVVHIPRVVARAADGNEWTSMTVAIAMGAIALALSGAAAARPARPRAAGS